MSRGKKAKRKIGGRRKQDSSMVAAGMRLGDVDGSSTLELNSETSDRASTSVRSSRVEMLEKSENLVTTESREYQEQSGTSADRQITNGSDFPLLFKSDELQTLRNVLRRSDLSRTPVFLGAIILGKVEIVKRLLRDGYPVNCRSEEDKTTALMWAVRRKDIEMINLLVRNGADLTLLDENNDNVALIAVQSSSWEQNDFIDFWSSIDRKIDPKHANTSGFTILHYARERHWDVLAKLIGGNARFFTRIDSIGKNACFCCYCSSSRSSQRRFPARGAIPTDRMESTLSHLTILLDEIVDRYREIWSRDRHLGYPDFRGGDGGDTATTLEDPVGLRREEIARLNTVLPKLEESYLRKLGDCWSSLLTKMRETAARDPPKFDEFVTSIQMQLLTHRVSPANDENLNDEYPGRIIETREAPNFCKTNV